MGGGEASGETCERRSWERRGNDGGNRWRRLSWKCLKSAMENRWGHRDRKHLDWVIFYRYQCELLNRLHGSTHPAGQLWNREERFSFRGRAFERINLKTIIGLSRSGSQLCTNTETRHYGTLAEAKIKPNLLFPFHFYFLHVFTLFYLPNHSKRAVWFAPRVTVV